MEQIIELTPQILGKETIKKSEVDTYLHSQVFQPKRLPLPRTNSFLVVDTKQYWVPNNPARNAPIHHYKYLDLPSHHDGAYFADSLLFCKPNITASNIEDEVSLANAFTHFQNEHTCKNGLENIHILPAKLEHIRSLVHTNQVPQSTLNTIAKFIILPGEYYISQADYNACPTMCINRYGDKRSFIDKPFFSFSQNKHNIISTFGNSWHSSRQPKFDQAYFLIYNTVTETMGILPAHNHVSLQKYTDGSYAYLFMKIDSLQRFYGKF